MPEQPDAAAVFTHQDAAEQGGYTIIPNAVMTRHDLSPAARLIYGWMKHLAWRKTTDEIEPPRQKLASDLGIGEKAIGTHLRELQNAPLDPADPDGPKLVAARRRGQGRTNVYVINGPLGMRESGTSRTGVSPVQERADRPFLARARSFSEPKTRTQEITPLPPTPEIVDLGTPPDVVEIDGRNLPLDALTEVCGIDPKSPRMMQAVIALNGRGKTVGIRSLFWIECNRHAEERGKQERLAALQADPETFARLLADRVRLKAAALLERDHWRTGLEPKLLREQWLDLELHRPDRGLSSDEIRSLGRALEGMSADELREFAIRGES